MTVVWEEPPRHGQDFGAILQEVTARPGTWARIATDPNPSHMGRLCHRLKGRVKNPPGNWTFVSRTLPDGTGAVFAMFEPTP